MKEKSIKVLNERWFKILGLVLLITILASINVCAADADTSLVNSLFDVIIVVLRVFGGAIAFVGSVEFLVGFFGGDPGARNVGIKLFFGGVLIIALSAARGIFGI